MPEHSFGWVRGGVASLSMKINTGPSNLINATRCRTSHSLTVICTFLAICRSCALYTTVAAPVLAAAARPASAGAACEFEMGLASPACCCCRSGPDSCELGPEAPAPSHWVVALADLRVGLAPEPSGPEAAAAVSVSGCLLLAEDGAPDVTLLCPSSLPVAEGPGSALSLSSGGAESTAAPACAGAGAGASAGAGAGAGAGSSSLKNVTRATR